jgi:hypothetical protein
MWDLNDATGSENSKIYAGNRLIEGITYYVQVRAKDGKEWSNWAFGTFTIKGGDLSIETSTGSGVAHFNSDKGIIVNLFSVDETSLPTGRNQNPLQTVSDPAIIFQHGFFSFNIIELTSGDTVTIAIILPWNVPAGSQFWMYSEVMEDWILITYGSDNGDNVILLTLEDGGIGDADGEGNEVIYHLGGIGIEVTLNNFPTVFNGRTVLTCVGANTPHGFFNDGAKTSDVLAVVDINICIQMDSTAIMESGRLDTEILGWPNLEWSQGYTTQDVVSVGGPVVSIFHHKYNDPIIAGAWWDYNTWEIVTATEGRYWDPNGRHCYIALISDEDRIMLLCSGYSADATRDIGFILKDYESYPSLLQGRACVFIPNDFNGDGDFLDPNELEILEIVN